MRRLRPGTIAAAWPGAGHRHVQPEGWRGQDHQFHQHRRSLSQYGRRVLIVDFDPQGAATVGLGINANAVEDTVYTALFNPRMDVHAVIQHTDFDNLDIMPANIDLSAAEVQLVTEVGREQVLAGVLRQVKDEYDVIIVDCQPSLGLLTVNALTAADGVIIPVAAEFFALRGVALLMQSIEKVQTRINPSLEVYGVLVTMFTHHPALRRGVATHL